MPNYANFFVPKTHLLNFPLEHTPHPLPRYPCYFFISLGATSFTSSKQGGPRVYRPSGKNSIQSKQRGNNFTKCSTLVICQILLNLSYSISWQIWTPGSPEVKQQSVFYICTFDPQAALNSNSRACFTFAHLIHGQPGSQTAERV